MKPATQLDVMILGREYRVACGEDEKAALLEAVAFLDSRMREIRDGGKSGGVERIAVMAALNIAHELLRERKKPAAIAGVVVDDAEDAGRIRRMSAAIDATLTAAQERLF
ncbi:MAG: cell division protein ZapA [Betaproteobacteria bacterium]|nr:cell division protein ZapA [Betaproteobacteria bacterium]